MALPASGGWRSLALAPLPWRSHPLLPDVGRGAESGGLPAQPGQHGPPLALHTHQLRVAQHPLHQLLVPLDARGRVLRREGQTRVSPGAPPGSAGRAPGAAPRGTSRGDRGQPHGHSDWFRTVCTEALGNWGEMWLCAGPQPGSSESPTTCPLPVSPPARRRSAAPGCSSAAAPMPA